MTTREQVEPFVGERIFFFFKHVSFRRNREVLESIYKNLRDASMYAALLNNYVTRGRRLLIEQKRLSRT